MPASWFFLGLAGYAALAVVAILDKFIVSRERVAPALFVFFSTAPAAPLLVAVAVFNPAALQAMWLPAALSGVSYVAALYTMYRGFLSSEVSHVGPLIGATIPVAVLGLSRFTAPAELTSVQLISIIILSLGSLVISFEKSRRHTGWHRGMLWGVAAGIFFASFHVAGKVAYTLVDFLPAALAIWGIMGCAGLLTLILPSVRRALRRDTATARARKKTVNELLIIGTNKGLAVVAVVLIQYAVALGNVAIVNAFAGVQYGLLVVLVALLSRFFPKKFGEYYTRAEKIQEGVAVVIIASGLALLAFS